MKVAVVTPYYKEDLDTLIRCRTSVLKQTYKDVVHYMLADGFPRKEFKKLKFHVELPACGDYGDTPRLVGCALADAAGVDAICLLDADCWFDREHVERLVKTMEKEDAPIVTCPRRLWRMDGTYMGVDTESEGDYFNDTNCYLIRRDAFHLLRNWGLKDKSLCIIDDRVLWGAVKESGLKIVRAKKATVNYPTSFAVHYACRNEPIPPGSKGIHQVDGKFEMVVYQ